MEYSTIVVVAVAVFLCGLLGVLAERCSRTRHLKVKEDEAESNEGDLQSVYRILVGKSQSNKTHSTCAQRQGDDSVSDATKSKKD